jgi:NAD(P)-dependent dehydrogenase (short-subunit alcohol dehydrogenase family)
MSKNKIEGRTALVTGANRGIGLAVTKALLNAGVRRVYAGARRTETLSSLVEEFGDRVVPVELDITSDAQVKAAASQAEDVNLVINNAGLAIYENETFGGDNGWIEAAKREMDTNLFGTYRMTTAFAPILKENGGGTVANVVSIAGFANFPLFASYSTTKAALHSLTQASRILLAGQGTEVLGIYPGPIETDMSDGAPFEKATPETAAAAIVAGIAAGTEEILTDPMAEEMGGLFAANPKELERQVGAMAAEMAAAS